MPEISIIVPVYKVEKYLDRCVKAILNQTFRDFELILVDDGSPDQCPSMCDEWAKKDERIRVIHKKNGGLSSARNAGLKIVKGNYILFVDSDDWIENIMVEYLYSLLKKNPESSIAQCGCSIVQKENSIIKQPDERIEVFDRKQMLNYFFRVNGESSNTGVWNKLIDIRILDKFEFVDTLNEDVEASYEFFNRANYMVISNLKFYYYFANREGITKKRFTIKDMDYLEVWDRIVERTEKENTDYLNYAEIGRKRAGFTLLSKMFLRGYDKSDMKLIEVHCKLRREVRQNFWELLKWNMPISRKVLLVILIF